MDADSWQKEQISRAYLHAVATAAGYTIADWNVDKDGVDATLKSHGVYVDLQLKCTQSPVSVSAGYSFQLDTATYDKLRSRDRSAPGYLALMIVPANVGKWLTHVPHRLILECHAYFARIQDRTDAATGATKAITLNSSDALDAAALRHMFVDSLNMVRRPG
jgi:hypothetical protein